MRRILYKILRQTGTCPAKKEVAGVTANDSLLSTKGEDIPVETIAAIGVALAKYEQNLFEMETAVLTIKRVAHINSPWSSKIYGISNQLNRK